MTAEPWWGNAVSKQGSWRRKKQHKASCGKVPSGSSDVGFFPHSYCIYAEGSPLLTGIFKCWPSPRITDNLTEKVPLANSCLTRLLIHEFISLPFSLALQEQWSDIFCKEEVKAYWTGYVGYSTEVFFVEVLVLRPGFVVIYLLWVNYKNKMPFCKDLT